MSGSVSRPTPVRQAFRASLKVEPEGSRLSNALHDVEIALDRMQRKISFRVDNDAMAADHGMLDAIRRLGGDLMAAADDYQNGIQ